MTAELKRRVFIQTNARQMVGALVAQYAARRNSANPGAFDVELLEQSSYPFFEELEGRPYLRGGTRRRWRNADLQSFTPLRFLPPERMGYEGRAIVTDPDVFAVGDVNELLGREMSGKALMCRPLAGEAGAGGALASSVMLLDCTRLRHWRCEEGFREMFSFRRDYVDWIALKLEPRESIGIFEDEWNDFDRLTGRTKMLHNTKRRTQPWKTGLPADYNVPPDPYAWLPPVRWAMRMRRRIFGEHSFLPDYEPHPDPNQVAFFFGLLRECLDKGIVTERFLESEMRHNNVRHDAMQMLRRAPLTTPRPPITPP